MERGYTYIVSVDFSNAYGTIDREKILQTLKRCGVHPRLIHFIHTYMDSQTLHFVDNTGTERSLAVQRGVLQGNAMSTLLFCAGLNDLVSTFDGTEHNTRIVAYADDVLLLAQDLPTLVGTWPHFLLSLIHI